MSKLKLKLNLDFSAEISEFSKDSCEGSEIRFDNDDPLKLKNNCSYEKKRKNVVIERKNIKKLRILGVGEFGKVHKVKDRTNKFVYARKKIKLDLNDRKKKNLEIELKLLQLFDHPNIVGLYSFYFRNGYYYVFLEYMNLGSVCDVLKMVKRFPENIVSKISKQILLGLQYLHDDQECIHRDLKCENILLDNQGVVKICDFGMANSLDIRGANVFETFQGTLKFMSPQRIEGIPHDFKSDIWALGLVVSTCALGKFPLEINKDTTLWKLLDTAKKADPGKFLRKKDMCFTEEFIDFVSCCLKVNPKERSSASKLLKHKFIKMYEKKKGKDGNKYPSIRSWLYENVVKIKKQEELEKKLKREKEKENKKIEKD